MEFPSEYPTPTKTEREIAAQNYADSIAAEIEAFCQKEGTIENLPQCFYDFPARFSFQTTDWNVIPLTPSVLEVIRRNPNFYDRISVDLKKIQRIMDDKTNLFNIEKMSQWSRRDEFTYEDITISHFLDPEVWSQDGDASEVYDFIQECPFQIKELAQKEGRRVNYNDLQKFLFPMLEQKVTRELELIHLADLKRKIKEVMEAMHDRNWKNLHITGLSSNKILHFLQRNHRVFTSEVLQKISPFGPIDEPTRQAILAGCVSSTSIDELLTSFKVEGPAAVLETFRGYKSCNASENGLVQELSNGSAAVAKISFPDGTFVLFGIKYEEVTLALCIESTHPDFTPQVFYIPVGNRTRQWCESIIQHYVEEKISYTTSVEQTWAVNRDSHYNKEGWRKLRKLVEEFIANNDTSSTPYEERYPDPNLPKFQSFRRTKKAS